MTDDTTRKPTLGEILHQEWCHAGRRIPPPFDLIDRFSRQMYEIAAKAVEAAVLEEITRSGHKVVPVEPTGKMLDALCHKAARGYVKQGYADMLEAAPEYKG